MTSKSLPRGLLKAISQFTTCDVGDALVKLKVPHGGFLSGLHMFSPQYRSGLSKICGPAHTVRMVHAADSSAPKPSQHFADTIPSDSVVFISQPKGLLNACWGGLMSTRASKLGAAGVVIDGRFRDINEHQSLNMGLFARGSSVLGPNTFTRSAEINVPVRYKIEEVPEAEDIMITPGDIIMGDADGVVAIPVEVAPQCLELCRQRAEVDRKTLHRLEQGDQMGPTIKALRK